MTTSGDSADGDADDYAARAENCRRIADTLYNPDEAAELRALAKSYDETAARLRDADAGSTRQRSNESS